MQVDFLVIKFVERVNSSKLTGTGSRPITEVKPCRAGLVLGWVTAWEYPVL